MRPRHPAIAYKLPRGVCSSNSSLFIQFRTLMRDGAPATHLKSTACALFLLPRRGVGYRTASSSLPYLLHKRLSDEDSRPERTRRSEGSLRSIFNCIRALPFSVCSKSFISDSYKNCRGVPSFFPKWNCWRREVASTNPGHAISCPCGKGERHGSEDPPLQNGGERMPP